MSKVGIHPPKTPVTKGSSGEAKATLPNVCKMPAPPAPFAPSPLPNTGKSGQSPEGYTTTVTIEGEMVAIRGATFKSMGDMASKGTGGGLISANTHGPTKFVTPGSPTVKLEGKAVHLLGEPMLNNMGASGSPPNTGSTLPGEDQSDADKKPPFVVDLDCKAKLASGDPKDKCDVEEVCAKVKAFNASKEPKKQVRPSPSNHVGSEDRARVQAECNMSDDAMAAHMKLCNGYGNGLKGWKKRFAKAVEKGNPDAPEVKSKFYAECRHKEWKENGAKGRPDSDSPNGIRPDHVHDAGVGGKTQLKDIGTEGLKFMNTKVNHELGQKMKPYEPGGKHGELAAHPDCECG